jgi:hypothetical protein
MSASIVAYGGLIWFGLPYLVASTLLLAAGFLAIRGRSPRVIVVTWIACQVLGYGVFGLILGIPLH